MGKRYIDADALIDDLMERYCKECNRRKGYSGKFIYKIGETPCRACEVDDVKVELEEAPTADVVEVVRCQNCHFFERNHFETVDGIPLIVAHNICRRWGNGCQTAEDGFCFMGIERSEDDSKGDN